MIKRTHILITSFLYLFALLTLTPFALLHAQQTPCPDGKYCALSTIPSGTGYLTEEGKPADPKDIVKNIYSISIGIAAILAIGMMIWAGIEYATAEAITGKSDAKKHWQGAVGGLILLISSYLILRTINIDLVNINLDLGKPQTCIENGKPCGASDTQATQQEKLTLITQKNQLSTEITDLEKLVKEKEAELAIATEQEDKQVTPDNARLAKLETELQTLEGALGVKQTEFQKTTALFSVVNLAENGLREFELAKKAGDIPAMRTSVQSLIKQRDTALSGMTVAATRTGFTEEDMNKVQTEFDEQISFINRYIEQRVESNRAGTKPPELVQPTFELDI